VPAPAPALASTAIGHNGHANGSNGRGPEPAWLQKLKAGAFDDD
jgi:hypothetical protein